MNSSHLRLRVFASALVVSSAAAAASNGQRTLADLLTPAFLAQNVATVCAARDPTFLTRLGGLSAITTFTEHVKRHVVEGLRPEEESRILVEAAGKARNTARDLLRQFQDPSPTVEARRLDDWCRTSAGALVMGAVQDHDVTHDVLVEGRPAQ